MSVSSSAGRQQRDETETQLEGLAWRDASASTLGDTGLDLGSTSEFLDYQFRLGGLPQTLFPNLFRISPRAWRSAQPSPWTIVRLARTQGLRTVVNLRGAECNREVLALEQDACDRLGIRLVCLRVKSRELPTREKLCEIREMLHRIAYPALFHCKSGADRVGLLSALYLHWCEGLAIEHAARQLRFFPFGHVSISKTGYLDHLFASYLADHSQHRIEFTEWIMRAYDRDTLARSFRPSRLLSGAIHAIIVRE
jgi:protein tyrosine/serine phosphatase